MLVSDTEDVFLAGETSFVITGEYLTCPIFLVLVLGFTEVTFIVLSYCGFPQSMVI
jgi:hypothetical protein